MTFFQTSIVAAGLAAIALSAITIAASTAEARSCRARIAGEGVGTGLAGLGTQNARTAAMASWSNAVARRYGSSYANTAKARSIRYDCRSGFVLQVKCVVTARPCR